ncbi:DUF2490 domain-containing protein [Sphingomonas morindae]|uniref:DUF2490 domain-containing protein n=1 Tax=Sphingomonas morindae TaxID=1541170 RepID=A0ABY4XBX8_9SPHN|nr:DUF2490 domain-containing protein [Sphingomonas morindae]USI74358.1 DUF2490 domain-containing protein [Sphingomonas morindae]
MRPLPRLARLTAAALFLLPLAGTPVAAATRQDGQIWVNLNAQGGLAGRLIYYAELQPRFVDGGARIGQVIARGALGWKLTPRISLYQGYAHVAHPDDALVRDVNEERSFQQLSWDLGRVLGGRLSSRTRFEQRLRSDGRDVALRLREFLRYTHRIGPDPQGVAALVSVEPMLALTSADWGPRAGFDQLRTNVGLEIPLTGRTTIEVGYLNQLVNRRAGQREINHIGQVLLALRP